MLCAPFTIRYAVRSCCESLGNTRKILLYGLHDVLVAWVADHQTLMLLESFPDPAMV